MTQTKEQIEDEYNKTTDLAWAEHNKIKDLSYNGYDKIRALAFAEKQRKLEELEELEDIKIIDGKKYRLVD